MLRWQGEPGPQTPQSVLPAAAPAAWDKGGGGCERQLAVLLPQAAGCLWTWPSDCGTECLATPVALQRPSITHQAAKAAEQRPVCCRWLKPPSRLIKAKRAACSLSHSCPACNNKLAGEHTLGPGEFPADDHTMQSPALALLAPL